MVNETGSPGGSQLAIVVLSKQPAKIAFLLVIQDDIKECYRAENEA